MNNLIYKINDLKRKEELYIIDYSNIPHFELRKNEIISKQINFYDKHLDILNESIILIQNLYDFIVMNKINIKINEKVKESKDYMYFLEIRGCFFLYLDIKNRNSDIFESLTDRKFAEWNNRKISQRLTFLSHAKKKNKLVLTTDNDDKISSILNNVSFMTKRKQSQQNKTIIGDSLIKNQTISTFRPKVNIIKSDEQISKDCQDAFFLTNAFSINNENQFKSNKINISSTRFRSINNNLSTNSRYVDAITNTLGNSKNNEKVFNKTKNKLSIDDNKLKTFSKDLFRNKDNPE